MCVQKYALAQCTEYFTCRLTLIDGHRNTFARIQYMYAKESLPKEKACMQTTLALTYYPYWRKMHTNISHTTIKCSVLYIRNWESGLHFYILWMLLACNIFVRASIIMFAQIPRLSIDCDKNILVSVYLIDSFLIKQMSQEMIAIRVICCVHHYHHRLINIMMPFKINNH
jgi:hypothetical protein